MKELSPSTRRALKPATYTAAGFLAIGFLYNFGQGVEAIGRVTGIVSSGSSSKSDAGSRTGEIGEIKPFEIPTINGKKIIVRPKRDLKTTPAGVAGESRGSGTKYFTTDGELRRPEHYPPKNPDLNDTPAGVSGESRGVLDVDVYPGDEPALSSPMVIPDGLKNPK